jgi:hypothetical protein
MDLVFDNQKPVNDEIPEDAIVAFPTVTTPIHPDEMGLSQPIDLINWSISSGKSEE